MRVGILVLRFRGCAPYCEVFDGSVSSAECEFCNKLSSADHIFHPAIPPSQCVLREFAYLVRELKVVILIYIRLFFRLWYMS